VTSAIPARKTNYAGLRKCTECKARTHFWAYEWDVTDPPTFVLLCEECECGPTISRDDRDLAINGVPPRDVVKDLWQEFTNAGAVGERIYAQGGNFTAIFGTLIEDVERRCKRNNDPAHVEYVRSVYMEHLCDPDRPHYSKDEKTGTYLFGGVDFIRLAYAGIRKCLSCREYTHSWISKWEDQQYVVCVNCHDGYVVSVDTSRRIVDSVPDQTHSDLMWNAALKEIMTAMGQSSVKNALTKARVRHTIDVAMLPFSGQCTETQLDHMRAVIMQFLQDEEGGGARPPQIISSTIPTQPTSGCLLLICMIPCCTGAFAAIASCAFNWL